MSVREGVYLCERVRVRVRERVRLCMTLCAKMEVLGKRFPTELLHTRGRTALCRIPPLPTRPLACSWGVRARGLASALTCRLWVGVCA